jgi:hypothetical protein
MRDRRLRHVNVTALTPATAEAVYALLTDGSSWPRWAPIDSLELERAGDPPPEGVGAIRVLRSGRRTGRDQIVELIENERFKYASLSGLPVRDYAGEVNLERTQEGWTTVRWHSSFLPKVRGTGWILERGIRRFLERCVNGLAEYATSAREVDSP